MSDDYRDGCGGKRLSLSWFLVMTVLAAAWLADRLPGKGKH